LYRIILVAKLAGERTYLPATLAVYEAPRFTSSDTIWGIVFKYDNSPITAEGYPVPVITESGTLPRGMSFSATGEGTAAIFGTPEFSVWSMIGGMFSGPTITLTARNSVGSAVQTIQLNIAGGGT
jgi:hypothetical protein